MYVIKKVKAAAMAACLAAVVIGCGGNEPVETQPAGTTQVVQTTKAPETVGSTEPAATDAAEPTFPMTAEEQGENVVLTTEYGTLQYPAAFSDVVVVKAMEHGEGRALEFYGRIADQELPLFTIWFGYDHGDLIGTLVEEDGTGVEVYLEIFELEETLAEGDQNTYYAAQEIVNTVLASCMENARFSAPQ